MTNKEAQTIIGNLPIYGDDCYSITEYQEAKAIAIKALETLEEFERAQIIMGGRLNGRTYAYKCGLEDGKRKSIRPKGKWETGYTYPDGAYWKCSVCKELIKVRIPMHFCSNCGADMRGKE